MAKLIKKEIEFAGRKLSLETGELAFQATMAVKASFGDTVVLTTVVSGAANPDLDFFPLTVNYEEKLYSGGQIKSSRFVKRDGRPTDDAVIVKRLVDHAIRPLFPQDYMDEVQVTSTVLSLDPNCDPEFLSMIAVSACLQASNIPWQGPMVSARIGHVDNAFVLCPPVYESKPDTKLDMMVSFAGPEKKFLAIEAEVDLLPEDVVLGAIDFARNNLDLVLALINDFAAAVNPDSNKYSYVSKSLDKAFVNEVSAVVKDGVAEMMDQSFDKLKLKEKQDLLQAELFEKFAGKYKKSDLLRAFAEIEKQALQDLILTKHKRPDGRGPKDIRSLTAKVEILPRTHGSALFTRGVTQTLTVATLGSTSLELFIQNMYGERTKRFIHYYNFPPFSTGETGKMGGPGSREIGHGMLAEKALRPVVPDQDEFPYMIILVSETLSSSGSSSMASTCSSTLALMDAGVPIKDIVAGVGVGLITNEDFTDHIIMTDLAYMEDAFGFLDFKLTGTRDAVTAIQCDMKLPGIPMHLLPKIFEQSKEGRLQVIDVLEKTLPKSRADVSKYAPKVMSVKIDPAKIGMVIGSGGKTIKEIEAKTGCLLGIEDDGNIAVSGSDEAMVKKAVDIILGIVKEVEVGEVYDGTVKEIVDFGAFVEILPGKDGLLHVSEMANDFIRDPRDVVKVGDVLKVKVIGVGGDGKVSLSKKALEPGYVPSARPSGRREDDRGGRPRRSFNNSRGGFSHGR
ncbi:MAG: Polyribonucleotide nucleotidyltransferase [candidate division WWE3 bacterium GW2011_GWB1_44_4]|uniref:Polyribonucleotide nucleotidyltransferase n=1 Tax=candidate division WWE3 bacterium GW2011_GWB1_44_4 TaxID=1619116 RepID=A0A0G1JCF0_UNCKA|nr:MAG: Polyribonucleotide nucleotidyltransferase [candidate division WWE3 bacterium GW2011_GWB1_44_4]